MFEVTTIEVCGFKGAFHGMRHPYKSTAKSDTHLDGHGNVVVGPKDFELAKTLAGSKQKSDGKFMRMIHVQADIKAPLYWWKEMDQYKIATTTNSESTMHTIMQKPLTLADFEADNLGITYPAELNDGEEVYMNLWEVDMKHLIDDLNVLRGYFMNEADPTIKKCYWEVMIRMLPESYIQTRTWDGDYQTLQAIWHDRKDHKLIEWTKFRDWIKFLPYSELITGEAKTDHRLEELNLNLRTHNALLRHGIVTVSDLEKLTLTDLLNIRDIGGKAVGEIQAALERFGVKLSE